MLPMGDTDSPDLSSSLLIIALILISLCSQSTPPRAILSIIDHIDRQQTSDR
jgi:hypothetical protein